MHSAHTYDPVSSSFPCEQTPPSARPGTTCLPRQQEPLHSGPSWLIVSLMGKRAVFWDRDDTLIADPGYIDSPDKVTLLPGAADALKRLADAGFENILVTNQSGIARGLLDEPTLHTIHERLQALLAEHGARLDAIYYCPYLPGEEAVVEAYRRDSDLRKPKPGMLLTASLERRIDLAASWAVGDSPRDCRAGRAAGCRTILLRPEGGAADPEETDCADFVAESLDQAVEIILKYGQTTASSPGQTAQTTRDNPVAVLQEILNFLRMVDRRSQREDFSFSRLIGTIVQIVAIGGLLYALFGWLVWPQEPLGVHMIRFMAVLCVQLLALTFFVISARPRH